MATDAEPIATRDPAAIPVEGLEARPFPGLESEFRVAIAESAHAEMLAHARTRPDVETCGVLVGDLCRDDLGPFLVVTDVVAGQGARQGDASVTFTHSTWERIHREMDERHPGRRIVGWYHTHPGFGVFLSDVDVFAHRNFFDSPWQLAVVVDPKSEQVGVFHWQGGEVVRARRFWIGSKEHWAGERLPTSAAPGKLARREAPAPPLARTPSHAEGPDWLWFATLGILGAICLVFIYFNLASDSRLFALAAENAALRRAADSDSAALTRDLAFRLRDLLDRGEAPSRALRSAFAEALRLDPRHRDFYEVLLPELAPPPAKSP